MHIFFWCDFLFQAPSNLRETFWKCKEAALHKYNNVFIIYLKVKGVLILLYFLSCHDRSRVNRHARMTPSWPTCSVNQIRGKYFWRRLGSSSATGKWCHLQEQRVNYTEPWERCSCFPLCRSRQGNTGGANCCRNSATNAVVSYRFRRNALHFISGMDGECCWMIFMGTTHWPIYRSVEWPTEMIVYLCSVHMESLLL